MRTFYYTSEYQDNTQNFPPTSSYSDVSIFKIEDNRLVKLGEIEVEVEQDEIEEVLGFLDAHLNLEQEEMVEIIDINDLKF